MLPGTVGAVQATETIKVLLSIGNPLVGRLLTYDALEMRFREVRLKRDPNCPLCGAAPTITDLSIHGGAVDALCAAESDHGSPAPVVALPTPKSGT